MDLKVNELAKLLNIPEGTVQRWAQDGKMPSYEIQGQLLFNPMEVEDWIVKQAFNPNSLFTQPENFESLDQAHKGMNRYLLYRAIYRGGVLNPVKGSTQNEVLLQSVKALAEKHPINIDQLHQLLIERESMMSTGVGHGIAIPHTREYHFSEHYDVVQVCYLEEPIEFNALDGKPVDVLFVLLASDDRRHLKLLSKIAHLINDVNIRKLITQRQPWNVLLEHILKWEDHLSAAQVT